MSLNRFVFHLQKFRLLLDPPEVSHSLFSVRLCYEDNHHMPVFLNVMQGLKHCLKGNSGDFPSD